MLAAVDLRNELLAKVLKDRRLRGGPIWRRELVASAVRATEQLRHGLRRGARETPTPDLFGLLSSLSQDDVAGPFRIDDIWTAFRRLPLGPGDSLETLAAQPEEGGPIIQGVDSRQSSRVPRDWKSAVLRQVRDTYTRALAGYQEVVQADFATLACHLPNFICLPVTLEVAVYGEADDVRLTIRPRARRSEAQPRVTVAWTESTRLDDWERQGPEVAREFEVLGRRPPPVWLLDCAVPEESAFSLDTPVMTLIAEWLERDLKSLFADVAEERGPLPFNAILSFEVGE